MYEPQEINRSAPVCILVLCGLPGSGKSRLASILIEQSKLYTQKNTENPGCRPCFIHIEYDELLPPDVEKHILSIKQDEELEDSRWKRYRNDILTCVDVLISYIKETITKGPSGICMANILDGVSRPETVQQELWERFTAILRRYDETVSGDAVICFIVDDNMYYRSMRYKYYQFARKYTVGFCQCCLLTSTDRAISRNHARQVVVNDDVITTMATRLETPDGETNTWETFSVVYNEAETSDCLADVVDLVRKASENPVVTPEEADVESRNRSREICSASFHHQADQIIRRIITQEMAVAKENGIKATELKELAGTLQGKRKALLQDLKSGVKLVPCDLNIGIDGSKDKESQLFEFIKKLFSGTGMT